MAEPEEQAPTERPESHVLAERREKLERLRDEGIDRSRTSSRGGPRSRPCGPRTRGSRPARRPRTPTGSPAGSPPGAATASRRSSTSSTAAAGSSSTRAPTCSASVRTSCSPGSTSATSSASTGTVFATRRGELSLRVDGWTLLAKSLRPPPDKFHGLEDTELRYRHRELDLIANPEAREIVPQARRDDHRGARVPRLRGLRRGRDAGAPAALRRRPGAAVHHPPQRARPRPLPADRDRALPQAPDRRRDRARL